MYVTAGLGDETIRQKYCLNNVSAVPKIACASAPHVSASAQTGPQLKPRCVTPVASVSTARWTRTLRHVKLQFYLKFAASSSSLLHKFSLHFPKCISLTVA